MENLNPLEQAVLDMLLAGDHPALATLRVQAERMRLVSREFSGVGFFCTFEVPPEAPQLEGVRDLQLADVNAEMSSLKHGAGFVLFVCDGRIDTLEGFAYGERWPEDPGQFELAYQRKPRELPFPNSSIPKS